MKVLFLTPWYPDDPRLQGIFVREQAVALSERHDIFLISSKISKDKFGLLSYTVTEGNFEGIKEHRLTVRRSFPIYNQVNFLMVTLWYTWRKIREFNPDIVHGNIGYPGAFWAWFASKKAKTPFVVTEHSTRYDRHFRSPFHKFLSIFFLKKASAVMAVSENSAKDIASYIGSMPVVVPNMVMIDKFRAIKQPPDDIVQIGFLGGLDTPRKGLDIFLKAMASIHKPYTLHIGGAGQLTGLYQAQARDLGIFDRCIFYGFIPEGRIPEFMSKFHFFVSTSREEGFGMVITESMASGAPVIATRSGGPEDFITAANGLLVPVDDVIAVQEAIKWMIDNYPSFDKNALRTFVAERYAPSVIVSKITNVYLAALNGRNASGKN